MLQPGSLVSRLLAVTLLFSAVMLGYRLAILPYWRLHQSNLEEIDRTERLLERYGSIIKGMPEFEEQLATLRDVEEQVGTYVPAGGDDPLSEEPWAGIIALIEKSGGELLGSDTMEAPAAEDDASTPVDRTGLHLEFRITMAGLAATLYDIEIVEPRLMIRQLHVLSPEATIGDGEPRIDVRLDVFGHSQPAGS